MTINTYIYRLRLTVVGVGSEEVSAVTRLRMTSMVHTALTGIFYLVLLSVRTSLRSWPQMGERRRGGPGRAIIIQDTSPKVTWLKLHWAKCPLAYKEVQTVWNYCRLDWISRIHSLLWPSSNEPLITADCRQCCVPGTQSSHSSNKDHAPVLTYAPHQTTTGREPMEHTYIRFA